MSTAVGVRYTPEQYLALERRAEFKSEYIDGEIRPMPGASRLHNVIAGNFYTAFRAHLRGGRGQAFMSDMRVRVAAGGPYTYPDVIALVGEARFEDAVTDTLLNPTVIVEVLSPSTASYDRGEKFASYRRLDSLQEYVLVSQERVHVERFLRRGGDWMPTEFRNLDDVLRLDSIGCDIPLREVYTETPLAEMPRGEPRP
jgi:Uma2 family endonuclease